MSNSSESASGSSASSACRSVRPQTKNVHGASSSRCRRSSSGTPRRLAEAGAAVLLADLRKDRLDAAGARLAGAGRTVATTVGDVSEEQDVADLVARAVAEFGRLDVLVNNAGVFSNFLLESLEPEEFRRILRVNVGGAFLCTRAAAARMREQGNGGSIINISSIDAVHPSGAGLAHYGTSKHAIWGLTKSMALELGADGIRVNAIAPGPALTEGAVQLVEDGAPGGIRRRRP